jgi:hypothetical protein
MPSVSASVDVSAPHAIVYQYLQTRYDSETHRSASLATKGYVPNVTCLEAAPNNRLVFQVRGRDTILRIFVGGWRWTYEIETVNESVSRVRITYRWGWEMSLLGAGTIGHQACNEITETAMALDALSWGRGEPAAAADPGH